MLMAEAISKFKLTKLLGTGIQILSKRRFSLEALLQEAVRQIKKARQYGSQLPQSN